MDSEAQKRKEVYAPLLENRAPLYESIYDRPLPCCGCGIGWCSFLIGFLVPLTWYYGTYLFFTNKYRHDARERPGLGACAIAALVVTVAGVITGISLIAQNNGAR
ncbi:unnamed protein product [Calypogeia fissa]